MLTNVVIIVSCYSEGIEAVNHRQANDYYEALLGRQHKSIGVLPALIHDIGDTDPQSKRSFATTSGKKFQPHGGDGFLQGIEDVNRDDCEIENDVEANELSEVRGAVVNNLSHS